MKNKEKIKQIFLSITAVVLIGIGYLNWNLDKNDSIEVSANSNDINLGDVQLVNTEPVKEENKSAIVSNAELQNNLVKNEAILQNSKEPIKDDSYFEETRIERDRMYSEMLEIYQKLIDTETTPLDQKAIAVQEVSNITKEKNGIMISENLIKNKGFENVIILVNNGNISVIIKSQNLTQEQISQIQNIVQRELEVAISNISISNKY